MERQAKQTHMQTNENNNFICQEYKNAILQAIKRNSYKILIYADIDINRGWYMYITIAVF